MKGIGRKEVERGTVKGMERKGMGMI